MARVHDGKIGRGDDVFKEKRMTVDSHVYSMVHRAVVKTTYASVTCPVCRFVNKIEVKDEKEVIFRCICGQMLRVILHGT